MKNEPASRLDRAAAQHAHALGARRQADRLGFRHDVELGQELAELDLLRPVIDDDAHGAVLAMGAHVDDRARKWTFPQRGHRDQELSLQTGRRRGVRPFHNRLSILARAKVIYGC